MSKVSIGYDTYVMHEGIHAMDPAILDAEKLLFTLGYDLRADQIPGTMKIGKFRTRPHGRAEWDEWDADLGREDLAFLVNMLMNPATDTSDG